MFQRVEKGKDCANRKEVVVLAERCHVGRLFLLSFRPSGFH